jgi:hypothetical protein
LRRFVNSEGSGEVEGLGRWGLVFDLF